MRDVPLTEGLGATRDELERPDDAFRFTKLGANARRMTDIGGFGNVRAITEIPGSNEGVFVGTIRRANCDDWANLLDLHA